MNNMKNRNCFTLISLVVASLALVACLFLRSFGKGRTIFLIVYAVLFALAAVGSIFIKPQETQVKNRLLWLDLLKVISMFFIVIIHSGMRTPFSQNPASRSDWWGYLLLNSITRCAVPIFIMITGALSLGKEISIQDSLRKAGKAAIILVFWNVFYIVLQHKLWNVKDNAFMQILKLPVQRGPSGHLWYGYLIVAIYLFMPILQVLYKTLSQKQRLYFVAVTLGIPGILDLYGKTMGFETNGLLRPFSFYITIAYMGMLFVGRIIFENKEFLNKHKSSSCILMGGGVIISILLTCHHAITTGKPTDMFLSETNIFVVAYSAGVMGLFCAFQDEIEKKFMFAKPLIVKLGTLALGMYYFHAAVRWMLGDFEFLGIKFSTSLSPIMALFCCVMYFVFAAVGVWCMEKVPVLRHAVVMVRKEK